MMSEIPVVAETLLVGSRNDCGHLVFANQYGVTAVLNLALEEDWPRDADVRYLHFPIEDDEDISADQFDRIIAAIYAEVNRGRLLIHCVAGYSRAPVIAATYIALAEGVPFEMAMRRVKAARPVASPSSGHSEFGEAIPACQGNFSFKREGNKMISKDNSGNTRSEMNRADRSDGSSVQTVTTYAYGRVSSQTVTIRDNQGHVSMETVLGGKVLP